MQFLGIEIAPSSTRVTAYDLEAAEVTGRSSAGHEWLGGLPEGHHEQDPRQWIEAVDRAVRSCLEQLGGARAEVAGIGVTGAVGGLVVLDADDRVVRPAKLGSDRSARVHADELARAFGGAPGWIEMTGNAVAAGSMVALGLGLKRREPEHFSRSVKWMTPQDFVVYWLTGERVTSAAVAASTGLFDLVAGEWCGEVADWIEPGLAGRLPAVIEATGIAGPVRSPLAASWGLAREVIVSPAVVDPAAAVLAAGASRPGEVVAELSASGVVAGLAGEAVVDYRGEGVAGRDLCGHGMVGFEMRNAVAAPEVFRRHYGWDVARFEAAIREVPVGADGLFFLPYLRGETAPRVAEGNGVLLGMSAENWTPEHFARATAEGVALGFGYGLSRLGELGFDPAEVRLARDPGPAMSQLLADVFGVPVVAVSGEGGPQAGAAMQAAVASFHHSGEPLEFGEIAGYLMKVEEATRRQPDPVAHDRYGELLARRQYLVESLQAGGFL